MIYTSLAEIASFNPCISGWRAVLKGQNKTAADAVIFPLTEIVDSNTISDVCWLLKNKKNKQVLAHFSRMCADSVKHLQGVSATAAAYATAAAAAAAHAATDAAAAAHATDAATHAAVAAATHAATGATEHAFDTQDKKNKDFLKQCITEYNANTERE